MNAIFRFGLAGLLLGCTLGCSRVITSSLVQPSFSSGKVLAGTPATVTVSVKDDRPAKTFLAFGMLGPAGDNGGGLPLAFQPASADEIPALMSWSAGEGVKAMGFSAGPSYALEVHLRNARIDLSRYSGYTPMNCVGYYQIETVLKAPDATSKSRTFNLAYYEHTTPIMSMDEVAEEAISRILHQAVLEAVVATLHEQFPGAADPAALQHLLETARNGSDEILSREAVFLLGLTAGEDPATRKGLVDLVQTANAQRVRQGALEAIGMLGMKEQVSPIQDFMTGKQALKNWDIEDTEEVWYLVKALSLLGVKDIKQMLPTKGLRGGARLGILARYMATGKIPELSVAAKAGQAKLQ